MVASTRPFIVNSLIGAGIFAAAPLIFVYSQSSFENIDTLFFSYQYWLIIFYYLAIYFFDKKLVVSRLFMRKKIVALYAAHSINTTRDAAEGILGNSTTDLANETIALTGDTSNGYTGSHTIGIEL